MHLYAMREYLVTQKDRLEGKKDYKVEAGFSPKQKNKEG